MTEKSIFACMPRGINFGWGVCGIHLTVALSKIYPLYLITPQFEEKDIGNESVYRQLIRLTAPKEVLKRGDNGNLSLPCPVIQAISDKSLRPFHTSFKAPFIAGYTFFETPFLDSQDIARANDYYDMVIAGSKWCEDILRQSGIKNTRTVIQGIDEGLFNNTLSEKNLFEDRFVVFSGGKLELRKGQDLVIRAFKVLQERHDDVLLINAWYNMWDQSIMTMCFSPYIRFNMPKGDYGKAINHLMKSNGIDPEKVLTMTATPHSKMASIYRNTDCGLFPNRCEGGTNLVLMEYMACGKPAIASYSSGHRDILKPGNSIPLVNLKKMTLKNQTGQIMEEWDDPDLEEIVEKLEWVYQHRDTIRYIGKRAAEDMSENTWDRAAREFLQIVTKESQ